MMSPDDKDIDALDAILTEAALAESEEGEITARDRQWADALRARTTARLAELRRNLVPTDAARSPGRPIRPSLQALERDALLALSNRVIAQRGGGLQIAYRHLTELSDDDLRRLLETLDVDPE
jgi:hypothetical protein